MSSIEASPSLEYRLLIISETLEDPSCNSK
nr:MAG TPA: hypothetical protein [Crassvirales sp.]